MRGELRAMDRLGSHFSVKGEVGWKAGWWRHGGDSAASYASIKRLNLYNYLILLVEPGGIEPPTSSMPLKRSPN
jgi:hypothetical protein